MTHFINGTILEETPEREREREGENERERERERERGSGRKWEEVGGC